MYAERSRRGSLLILVAGVSALLAGLAVAFLVRIRSDAQASRVILQDAQCRLMLAAAVQYIQETSRIGWGSDEAHGWTDVRTGGAGPLGASGASGPLPLYSGSTWPALGSAMRGDAHCWQRPPYALTLSDPWPVAIPATFADDGNKSNFDAMKDFIDHEPMMKKTAADPNYNYDDHPGQGWYNQHYKHWSSTIGPIWNPAYPAAPPATAARGVFGSPPATSTWGDFASGDRRIRAGSAGLAWFRIYREQIQEHDGVRNSGDDYDVEPFSGHGVFIITVGCGSTRGYRFWDGSGEDFLGGVPRTVKPPFSNGLEPETASASQLFGNAETFRALRAQERIQWFRVRWVPQVGGGLDAYTQTSPDVPSGYSWENPSTTRDMNLARLLTATPGTRRLSTPQDGKSGEVTGDPAQLAPLVRQGGSIEWIERLEQEPPRW